MAASKSIRTRTALCLGGVLSMALANSTLLGSLAFGGDGASNYSLRWVADPSNQPSAVVEVTAQPHTGCKKFMARFGLDALALVSSPEGRRLNLRGINARVVEPGRVRVGDVVTKLG